MLTGGNDILLVVLGTGPTRADRANLAHLKVEAERGN
jgi:hypothetical protein